MNDVTEFHRALQLPIKDRPGQADARTTMMRVALIREECDELTDALVHGDLVAAADGVADVVYTALGAAIECGLPMVAVWEAVHRSNLAKRGGGRRADGKVLKPEGWSAPDVAAIVANAAAGEGQR